MVEFLRNCENRGIKINYRGIKIKITIFRAQSIYRELYVYVYKTGFILRESCGSRCSIHTKWKYKVYEYTDRWRQTER